MDCRRFWLSKYSSMRGRLVTVCAANAVLVLLLAISVALYFSLRASTVHFLSQSVLAPNQPLSSGYESNGVSVYFPGPDSVEEVDAGWPVVRSRSDPDFGFESEALATLQAAQEFVLQGKYDKAEKLFEHASQMQPRHPEVLTQYGYFVEKKKGDVVAANLMYSLALTFDPEHSLANAHQKRTQPLVEEMDSEMLRVLDSHRKLFLSIPGGNGALRRHMREAYFQHVYHTVAIEGNTMSFVQTRSLLETRMAIGGKSIMEHNEILGMDAAWKYVNQSLVNRFHLITVNDILEIHRRVYGYVDPVEAGRFRRHQVFIGNFEPTHPENVETEVNELISWLHSGVMRAVHPVEVAALLHYKFVVIHPFVDGNGRVSRLLMNLVLMQAGFPPVVIRVEDRFRYYETLDTANQGDVRPFIRFIAQATQRTLEEYLRVCTVVDNARVDPNNLKWVDDGRTILTGG